MKNFAEISANYLVFVLVSSKAVSSGGSFGIALVPQLKNSSRMGPQNKFLPTALHSRTQTLQMCCAMMNSLRAR